MQLLLSLLGTFSAKTEFGSQTNSFISGLVARHCLFIYLFLFVFSSSGFIYRYSWLRFGQTDR